MVDVNLSLNHQNTEIIDLYFTSNKSNRLEQSIGKIISTRCLNKDFNKRSIEYGLVMFDLYRPNLEVNVCHSQTN